MTKKPAQIFLTLFSLLFTRVHLLLLNGVFVLLNRQFYEYCFVDQCLSFDPSCFWRHGMLLIFLVFRVVLCVLFVFVLCLVCPMLPVSLNCPLLIAASNFSNLLCCMSFDLRYHLCIFKHCVSSKSSLEQGYRRNQLQYFYKEGEIVVNNVHFSMKCSASLIL